MEIEKKFPAEYMEASPALWDVAFEARAADKKVMKVSFSRLMSLFSNSFVPLQRKVNSKQLNTDIILNYGNVGATRAGYDTVLYTGRSSSGDANPITFIEFGNLIIREYCLDYIRTYNIKFGQMLVYNSTIDSGSASGGDRVIENNFTGTIDVFDLDGTIFAFVCGSNPAENVSYMSFYS